MSIGGRNTRKYNVYKGKIIKDVDIKCLDEMVSYKNRFLLDGNSFYSFFEEISNFENIIENTVIRDRKTKPCILKLSKDKCEKLNKELGTFTHTHEVNNCREGELEKEWKWDEKLGKYVNINPLLGEYDPIHQTVILPVLGEYDFKHKRILLYVETIADVCASTHVELYCGVLTTFIHELFHAVHHVAADKGKRPYDTITEIEEAMTEFSTLVFLEELVNDKKRSVEWKNTFDWAKNSIKAKKNGFGDLPSYGFGYYLFDFLYCQKPTIDKEAYNWIDRYNQKIGAIDKKNLFVKCYQQMLNPEYPFKDERLCLELLHSILFNI